MSALGVVTAADLQKPFEASDIKWRVQQSGISAANNNPYVVAIPYVSNRAIQKRLDDLFGIFGWENVYKETTYKEKEWNNNVKEIVDKQGFLCGITIHSDARSITRWDGAGNTNIDPLKGGLSGSMKRAAVQLGIGRYLYDLKPCFAKCRVISFRNEGDQIHIHKDRRSGTETMISWEYPDLPLWALPFEDFSQFIGPIDKSTSLAELKVVYGDAYKAATNSGNEDLKTQANKAKDIRKQYIIDNAAEIERLKFEEILKWLKNEVKVFEQLPTKLTVDPFFKRIKESLSLRAKSECVDDKPLQTILKTAHNNRLKEIKEAK